MTDHRACPSGLVGRDRALTLARDLLLAERTDVDIVGPRHSGRSSMADAVAALAADAHRPTIRVNGVRSLATTPLAALHAAGFGASAGQDRRPTSLQQAIDALAAAVAEGDAVILLDDADLLDDVSTGAIDAVRRATGVPVLRTRARIAETADSGYVVDLPPLSYDELTTAVTRRLGGPVDAATMSRLYSVTGGNVGVAISTVRLAVVEGALSRRGGRWTATGGLWSPSLRGLALQHLAVLDPDERSALAAVAGRTHGDEPSVPDDGGEAALAALETAGVVKTVERGGARRFVLDPPLLSEHLRRTDEAVSPPDAVFVRIVHDDADTRRAAATADWNRSPTPESALALVRALIAPTGMPPGCAVTLDTALATAAATTEHAVRVELAELRARRDLGAGAELESVSGALHTEISALGRPYSQAADASVALLAIEVGAAPEHPGADDPGAGDDPGLPVAVRARLLRAAHAVALQRGRFLDAVALHDRLRSLPGHVAWNLADAAHGFALLGTGRHADALAWAAEGAAVSRDRLDVAALRLHSLVAGQALLIAGRTAEAAAAIATAAALGAPPVPGSAVEAGIRGLSAVIAARRGDLPGAERIRDELAAGPGARSAANEVALDWIDAALVAGRGRSDDAAALLRVLAGRLRSHRQEAAAALALLTALEHTADDDELDEAGRLVAVQQSELFDAWLALLAARARHADDAERTLAPRVVAVGLERLTVPGGEEAGFFSARIVLTDREREIVRFVADGLVYREIAARLHLSARTVEGIVARLIRKLGLRDRRELAALAGSGAL